MTLEDQRQECVNLIARQMRKSCAWRLMQSKDFPDDARNLQASQRLAELATVATQIPDDVWNGLKDHYHFSKHKFGEVVSTTNRNVMFRQSTPDFPTYMRNLLLNVHTEFSH
jgi:hypothetical protein